MANRPPDPRTLLQNRRDDYLLGCFLSLGLVLLSGVPLLFFAGGEAAAIVCVLAGAVLASATGLKAMALQRDLREGLATERCRVVGVIALRREVLSVRTPGGLVLLANYTGRSGQELVRRWVRLTYASASALALRAEDE